MQTKLIYEFGAFRLNRQERQLSREGRPVGLSPQLFSLLVAFVENPGHLLSKEELREKIWGKAYVTEEALKVIVRNLRKILGDGGDGQRYIENVRGGGYRFVCQVRVAPEENTDAEIVQGAPVKALSEISDKDAPLETSPETALVSTEAGTEPHTFSAKPNLLNGLPIFKSRTVLFTLLSVIVIIILAALGSAYYQLHHKDSIETISRPVGCITLPTSGAWRNVPFSSQQLNNRFIAEADITLPFTAGETLIGLSNGTAASADDLAAIVRFNSSGFIDPGVTKSRGTRVNYSPGESYHVKFVVDLTRHSYSAYVNGVRQPERLIGENVPFRSANSVTVRLTQWVLAGSVGVRGCNFAAPSFTTSAAWTSYSFPAQTSRLLSYEWDATPSSSPLDTVMTFSNAPQKTFTYMPILVRFGFSGHIEARRGSTFDSDVLMNYVPGATYHFRVAVNLPAHTYSVFVTTPGSSEVALASDYSFRAGQEYINELNTFNVINDWPSGSTRIANFQLTAPRLDRFGISQLHPAAVGGREWYSNWDNGTLRSFPADSQSWDPFDPEFQVAADNSQVEIGSGLLHVQGSHSRSGVTAFVRDRFRRLKWKNVEITFYARRGMEPPGAENDLSSGLMVGARTENQGGSSRALCSQSGGHALLAQILYSGEIKFQKQSSQDTSGWDLQPDDTDAGSFNREMPFGEWVGYKLVVLNVNDNSGVQLTLYRDDTGGKNGGAWQAVQRVSSVTPAVASEPKISQGERGASTQLTQQVDDSCRAVRWQSFLEPNTSIFIHSQDVGNVQFKWFSIREIAADPAQYNFESSIQNWKVLPGSMITSIQASTTHSYYGNQSLAVTFGGPFAHKSQVYVKNPPLNAASSIHYRVWCPSEIQLNGVSPFIEDKDKNWKDIWTPVSAMKLNSWSTFELTLPPDVRLPLQTVGIEFVSDMPWTGTCYMDSISW